MTFLFLKMSKVKVVFFTELGTLLKCMSQNRVKIRERRMRLAGHCVRHPELAVSPLVLWEPIDGIRSKGRRRIPFVDQLKKDATQQETSQLRTLMLDRDAWKTTIRVSREGVG